MRPNLIETRRDAIIWERCRSAEADLHLDSTRVQGTAEEGSVADTARGRGWRRADHVVCPPWGLQAVLRVFKHD